MAIDEKLLALTTENEQLKAEIVELKKANELAQIDFTQKLAINKVDFEQKELAYKKQVRDLTLALETRDNIEANYRSDKPKKSVTELYDEAFNK